MQAHNPMRTLTLGILIVLVAPVTEVAGQDMMYWADHGLNHIQRSDLDGNNVEDLVTGLATALPRSLPK